MMFSLLSRSSSGPMISALPAVWWYFFQRPVEFFVGLVEDRKRDTGTPGHRDLPQFSRTSLPYLSRQDGLTDLALRPVAGAIEAVEEYLVRRIRHDFEPNAVLGVVENTVH